MPLLDDLKWLARLPRSSNPFLSLYLNARWDGEKKRERVRIFVKNELKACLARHGGGGNGGGRRVAEDVDKLDHYVKGLVNREWDEEYAGVAVFACAGLGVYRVVRSQMPFADRFVCSDRPLLRPAAEHAHAGESALLAAVAGDGGRVLALELGAVRKDFAFRDEEFPGRHDQGGWSQARYQRHVEDHIHRNLKRLANQVVRWTDERGVRRVLLSGSEPLLAAFEGHLPRRVAERICARLRLEPAVGREELLAATERALTAARERDDADRVHSLLERRGGAAKTAVGPDPVAAAVATGKVRRLFLDTRFRESGWKCGACGMLGVKVPLGCPACAEPVEGVDLGEEYIRGTLATDGMVVPVSEHSDLLREGGVAAQLRYAAGRAGD